MRVETIERLLESASGDVVKGSDSDVKVIWKGWSATVNGCRIQCVIGRSWGGDHAGLVVSDPPTQTVTVWGRALASDEQAGEALRDMKELGE